MQSAAFLALDGGADNQVGHQGQVAQLQQVAADLVVAVILPDLLLQHVDPVLGPLQALVGTNNTHVVPHETAQFIPVVGDDHVFIRVGYLGFVPIRSLGRLGHVGALRGDVLGAAATVDEAFQQGVAGHPVGAVQARKGGFSHRVELVDIGASLGVDHNAAAGIVGGGDNRNRLAGDLDTLLQTALVVGRKVRGDELCRPVANVQIDTVAAQALDFMVDG